MSTESTPMLSAQLGLERTIARRIGALSPRMLGRSGLVMTIFTSIMLLPAMAFAVADQPSQLEKCVTATQSGSLEKIKDLIQTLTNFMMAIGAAGSILVFAIAALLFLFGAATGHQEKAKSLIRGGIIGLAILAGGFIIQRVVVDLVLGGLGKTATDACAGGKPSGGPPAPANP